MNTKYKDRGFTITDFYGNDEFDHLHGFLAPDHLHTCAANEHIRDIERSTQTIKERVRCGCHSIAYKKFTKLMMIYLIKDMITYLGMLRSKMGYQSTSYQRQSYLGPWTQIHNKQIIKLVAYSHVYIVTTNSAKTITVGAIALRIENKHGRYYFISLPTGKHLQDFIWTELPINDKVIQRERCVQKEVVQVPSLLKISYP